MKYLHDRFHAPCPHFGLHGADASIISRYIQPGDDDTIYAHDSACATALLALGRMAEMF